MFDSSNNRNGHRGVQVEGKDTQRQGFHSGPHTPQTHADIYARVCFGGSRRIAATAEIDCPASRAATFDFPAFWVAAFTVICRAFHRSLKRKGTANTVRRARGVHSEEAVVFVHGILSSAEIGEATAEQLRKSTPEKPGVRWRRLYDKQHKKRTWWV